MARIEYVETRLINWARWKESRGVGALGYAAIRLGGSGVGNREAYREARVPISDCEAEETNAAVMALPSVLRATVEEVYCGRGGELDHLARLCIGRTTLKTRVSEAHRQLSAWFAERERVRRDERARVERRQTEARPARGGFYT